MKAKHLMIACCVLATGCVNPSSPDGGNASGDMATTIVLPDGTTWPQSSERAILGHLKLKQPPGKAFKS